MKALKLKLAIAKEEHAALRPTVQLPDTKAYIRALHFIAEEGAELKKPDDGVNKQREIHNQIIAAHTTVMAYRAEKKRLAEVVNAVRREMLAAATKSDLE